MGEKIHFTQKTELNNIVSGVKLGFISLYDVIAHEKLPFWPLLRLQLLLFESHSRHSTQLLCYRVLMTTRNNIQIMHYDAQTLFAYGVRVLNTPTPV